MLSLKGDLVRLRAVEPEDADIIFDWENNEANWQLSNTLTPFSKHIITQFVETAHRDIFENKQLRLMIDELKSGKTIGSIDLFDFDPYHLRAGVGILINAEEDRRKGFASDSLKCLIDYCKNHLTMHQLYCCIGVQNHNSIQLFERLGFEQIGTQKQWQRIGKNQWEDVYFYQYLL